MALKAIVLHVEPIEIDAWVPIVFVTATIIIVAMELHKLGAELIGEQFQPVKDAPQREPPEVAEFSFAVLARK